MQNQSRFGYIIRSVFVIFFCKKSFSNRTFDLCADLEALFCLLQKKPISWPLRSAPVPWCEATFCSCSLVRSYILLLFPGVKLNSTPVPWCEAKHPSYFLSVASGMVIWQCVRCFIGLRSRIRSNPGVLVGSGFRRRSDTTPV